VPTTNLFVGVIHQASAIEQVYGGHPLSLFASHSRAVEHQTFIAGQVPRALDFAIEDRIQTGRCGHLPGTTFL